jgi:hypothetical protein
MPPMNCFSIGLFGNDCHITGLQHPLTFQRCNRFALDFITLVSVGGPPLKKPFDRTQTVIYHFFHITFNKGVRFYIGVNFLVWLSNIITLHPPFIMANNSNKEKKADKQDSKGKLERLIEYLQNGKCSQFTGYIKINFSQGHIGRIEKFEEILRK